MEERFEHWKSPQIEEGRMTQWHWVVQHAEKLQLGKKTDIGAFTYLNAKHGIVIEDNVQIGSHCSLYSVSTIDKKEGKIILKKGCMIGSHSIVMPGVTIGEGAVVGAFSFVDKDIPAYSVAVGIPVKVIRSAKQ